MVTEKDAEAQLAGHILTIKARSAPSTRRKMAGATDNGALFDH